MWAKGGHFEQLFWHYLAIWRDVSIFVKCDTIFRLFSGKLPQIRTSKFCKVVQQHTEDMAVSIIWVLLKIYFSFQQWKNFDYLFKSPKTPILAAWIDISSQICEKKNQIAISSDLCIRLTWNLTGSCGQQHRLHGWSRMVVKQFQDGGRPPFWKSLYRHISAQNHQISIKLCTQQQILNWLNVT